MNKNMIILFFVVMLAAAAYYCYDQGYFNLQTVHVEKVVTHISQPAEEVAVVEEEVEA